MARRSREHDLDQDLGRIAYTVHRVRRHVQWARDEGVARLMEEDSLNPFTSTSRALSKLHWRRREGVERGDATAVFLVGVQRSGTNMLVRGLEAAPEFEVHSENDRAAFHRFRLRPDPVIEAIINRSRHRFVLFKPLCDSHRTVDLLEGLRTRHRPKAIWAFRDVDGRVRSALSKFGDANLRALRSIAAGTGDHLWQAQRLSEHSREVIGSVDWDRATPATAAATFWYVRNRLYFEAGLDRRDDVAVLSYQAVLADPTTSFAQLCDVLGTRSRPSLVAHIDARRPRTRDPLPIDPAIRGRCDELYARLSTAAARVPRAARRP